MCLSDAFDDLAKQFRVFGIDYYLIIIGYGHVGHFFYIELRAFVINAYRHHRCNLCLHAEVHIAVAQQHRVAVHLPVYFIYLD